MKSTQISPARGKPWSEFRNSQIYNRPAKRPVFSRGYFIHTYGCCISVQTTNRNIFVFFNQFWVAHLAFNVFIVSSLFTTAYVLVGARKWIATCFSFLLKYRFSRFTHWSKQIVASNVKFRLYREGLVSAMLYTGCYFLLSKHEISFNSFDPELHFLLFQNLSVAFCPFLLCRLYQRFLCQYRNICTYFLFQWFFVCMYFMCSLSCSLLY